MAVTISKQNGATRRRWCLAGLGTAAACGLGLAWLALASLGVPPRALAIHLEQRAAGHAPFVTHTGQRIARLLIALDRPRPEDYRLPSLRLGAQDTASASPQSGRTIMIGSSEQALAAIHEAQPDDVITFLPGRYRFGGSYIEAARPGRRDAPITVRAQDPGSVLLEFDMSEGFRVSAPYWTFENLVIRGVCEQQADCEHAFHIVGDAGHFVARNNRIVDFNAHFKINAEQGSAPDHGLIDDNTLSNSAPRQTDASVTPIDLVAASHWLMRSNLISDFVKSGSDQTSYGGFAKGAGADNRFVGNVVLCEYLLHGMAGRRVGLSLGGGGTDKAYCRDRQCITEQDGSLIAANLIAFCSDDGIYLNRAAGSRVLHNTLLDTGGIVARYPQSSADIEGNLVDGAIRSRDEALVRAFDNRETALASLFLGLHPVRALFADARALDLAWRSDPPRRRAIRADMPDLCGATRPPNPSYGAFEDYTVCLGSGSKNRGP